VADLFKHTAPIEPERPEEPRQGWGYTAAFTVAGLAAGAISGYSVGAHMGGIWGGISGATLNLVPTIAAAVLTALPLSDTDLPEIITAGVPLAVFGGGIALGAYWGNTGNLGGPIGLGVTGAITGGLLVGVFGFFQSESGYEKKLEAHREKMSQYHNQMQRYGHEMKTYEKDMKAWSERKEEKSTSTRIIEGAKRLFLNGITLKKREKPEEGEQKREEDSIFSC
jgi:hypothetical protein